MKRILIVFLILTTILSGCQKIEEEPAENPVYEFNYSPAVRPILPAVFACAAEFPDVIFSPDENYYQSDVLSIQLGEPEAQPSNLIPIAYDEIVLITNPSNPIIEWTDFRIINIMNGRIENWDYLGWEGEIQIFLPDPKDEVYNLFNLYALDNNPTAINAMYAGSHQDILNEVSGNLYAIGVVPASFTDESVLTHSINIQVPVLALFDSVLDQVQNDFLLCLQSQTAQSELENFYGTLP